MRVAHLRLKQEFSKLDVLRQKEADLKMELKTTKRKQRIKKPPIIPQTPTRFRLRGRCTKHLWHEQKRPTHDVQRPCPNKH